jgi:hypothetical protein
MSSVRRLLTLSFTEQQISSSWHSWTSPRHVDVTPRGIAGGTKLQPFWGRRRICRALLSAQVAGKEVSSSVELQGVVP